MSTRITIERTVFAKLNTQLQKDKNRPCKLLLADCKITTAPNSDAILWDPNPELLKAIAVLLENELTFMRKKESASYLLAQKVIARLKKAYEPYFPGAQTPPGIKTTPTAEPT